MATPQLTAAQAIQTAIEGATLTEAVTVVASYWVRYKPEDLIASAEPLILVMPQSFAQRRATRGKQAYEIVVRIALRHRDPDPDAIDALWDSIVDLFNTTDRFGGYAVTETNSPEVFDAELYRETGVAAFNLDVTLIGHA